MLKKIVKILLSILGLLSFSLCVAFAIKTPDVFTNLFNKREVTSDISGVPYYCNFGDLGTSDNSYKTQYFEYGKKNWYLSWGNFGSKDNFNMLLGWNNRNVPKYGGYSYQNEVMNNIKLGENDNYSYLLMDFDFELNHYMEWSFGTFNNVGYSDTSVYLINSHNSGSSWEVLEKFEVPNKFNDTNFTLKNTENSLTTRKTRYGLVLVSSLSSEVRIELNQFVVQRLSIVK